MSVSCPVTKAKSDVKLFVVCMEYTYSHFTSFTIAFSSVRPIREFQDMPITDINMRTHPITDTDIRYEGHSVAVGLLLMPYSLPPPTFPDTPELAGRIGVWATRLYARIKRPSVYAATVYVSKSQGKVGRHCPQALGQTVLITSKQASGAKRAGRGRGRCTQASLWV